MNWTTSANYKVKYPDPLPAPTNITATNGLPIYNNTATISTQTDPKPQTQKQVVTQWLLDKLQEESAEVIQAVSKVRRFGGQNHHPDRQTTNYEELVSELTDWLAIVAALEHTRYFDLSQHQNTIHQKTLQLIS